MLILLSYSEITSKMEFEFFCVKCQVTRNGMGSQHRVGHCSFSMGSCAAILGPCFKSCDGSFSGNKPIGLPFHDRKVVEFSSPFAARSFALGNFLH